MSTQPPSLLHSYLARQLGTLALCHVQVESSMIRVRAASWFNSIARFGIYLPLFVVHDLGALFASTQGPAGYRIESPRANLAKISPPFAALESLRRYEQLLNKLAASEVVTKLSGWRLRDDLISVLLTRILSDVYLRWQEPTKAVGVETLPLSPSLYASGESEAVLFNLLEKEVLWGFLEHLTRLDLHVYTCTELIDLDTVRLLGLFREDSAAGADSLGSSLDLVDLYSALNSPEANDVANFSLDLLPSVLETKRASGTQAFSVDGYASIERRGNIDSLMLSELAYDEELFEQKVVNQELLYFGHEREREDERRLQYILVDSSASMRGKRQVFARGLALTLAKKIGLLGDDIWLRFFDSRLHEIVKVGKGGSFPVPYVLSFRSERGRNYGKVFRQLLVEIERLGRTNRRQTTIYIITHGQCHVAPELIAALAEHATLYGIIILPSSELSLEFLPFLDKTQIVEDASFRSRAGRRDRALDIVDDVSARADRELP